MCKKTIKALGQSIEANRVLTKNSLLFTHFSNSISTFNSESDRAPVPFRIKKKFDSELQVLLNVKQSFRLSKVMSNGLE
jgi:hypothetical protein